MNNKYISLLIQLKNSSYLDRRNFKVKYNLKTLELVQFLYDNGVIQYFHISKEEISINIRYFLGTTPVSGLKWFSRRCFFNSLNFSQMSKIPFKGQVVCVSTDKGLLTIEQCKKYKIGGIILLIC